LAQLVVACLLARREEHEAHLAGLRAHYATRAEALTDALERHLGDRLELRRPEGGMFVWATATDGTDTDEVLGPALERGVAFVPGRAFDATGTGAEGGRSMRLSFATLDPPELDEAVARLADAWRAHRPTGTGTGWPPPRR
jgi:2-aminoadipate transaminase